MTAALALKGLKGGKWINGDQIEKNIIIRVFDKPLCKTQTFLQLSVLRILCPSIKFGHEI